MNFYQITAESLTEYMSIGLIIAFAVIVGLLVLSFLSGLFKGWRYGTYRFLFFAVLVLIAFCTLKPISSLLGTLDLSQWVPAGTRIQFNLDVSGTSVAVDASITSLSGTIGEVVTQILKAFDVSMSPEALSSYVTSLVSSFLILILVFIDAILISLLGSLLCFLLWHILFKHFIQKEKRKRKTLRLVSAFEEFAMGAVILAMFVTPFTSIANALSQSFNEASKEDETSLQNKGKEVTPEIYETVKSVVDTYDDSLLSKVFFSWSKDENGKTFDTAFYDFVGAIGVDDQHLVSFVTELSSLAKVGTYAIKGGVLSEEGVNQASLLTFAMSSYAPKALAALSNSSLVETIMPYALAVATNLDSISEYLKTETTLDFTQYNYGDTLSELADLYKAVVDSDILSSIVSPDGEINQDPESLSEVLLNHFDLLKDTILAFDDERLKLFNDLMKSALWVQIVNDYSKEESAEGTNIYLKDFFPEFSEEELKNDKGTPKKVPASIQELTFKDDIMPILDGIYRIATVDDGLVPLILEGALKGNFTEDLSKQMISILLANENLAQIEHYFDGYTDSSVIVKEDDPVLLSSSLVQNAVPKLMKMAESMTNSSLGLSGENVVDLSPEIEDYKKSTDKEELAKRESQALFSILRPFAKSQAGKDFLLNYDTMPGIYFSPKDGSFLGIKDELLAPLSEGLKNLDSSKLAKAFVPSALNGILEKNSEKIEEALGTKLSPHVTKESNIGHSFAALIDSFSKCQDLVTFLLSNASSINGLHDAEMLLKNLVSFKVLETSQSQFSYLLSSMANNALLDDEKHSNIRAILVSLLDKGGLGDLSEEINEAFDENGFDLDDNLSGLSDFLEDVANSGLLSKLDRVGKEGLAVFQDYSFENLLSNIDRIPLLSKIIGTILENKLAENETIAPYLSYGDGKKLSFENVTSWGSEGRSIDALLKFAIEVGDLGNLNLFSGDADSVESLIKTLSSSHIFYDEKGNYILPEYLADKIVDSFTQNTATGQFFVNFDTNSKLPLSGDSLKEKASYSEFKKDFLSVDSPEKMGEEASKIGDFLRAIQIVGSIDFLSDDIDFRTFNVLYVEDLFTSLSSSRFLRRVPLTHAYYSLFDYLKNIENSFSYANPCYFYPDNVSDEERNQEIEYVLELLETVTNPYFGALNPTTGKIDSSKFDLVANLSPDYFVRPVLNASSNSKILNTSKDSSGKTAFKSLLAKMVSNFSYFSADPLHSVQEVSEYVIYEKVTDWDREIDSFVKVLNDLQSLDMQLQEDFDFESLFEDGMGGKIGELKVSELLNDISESQILGLGLANKIQSALESLGGTIASDYVDFGLANPFFDGTDGSYTTLSFKAYSQKECEALSSLLRYGYALNGKASLDDFGAEDIDTWTNFLASMASSRILNSLKASQSRTVFQDTIVKLFHNDALKPYIFLDESPKDKHFVSLGEYANADEKVLWNTKRLIPTLESEESRLSLDVSSLNGDENSLKSVLKSLLSKDVQNALKSNDLLSLARNDTLDGLLSSLNSSPWTSDFVPNAIASSIKNGSFAIEGIELSRANPFFQYKDGYFASMPREEISLMSSLMSSINDSDIRSLSNPKNIKGVEDVYLFRNLLHSLEDSEIFHKAGASYDLKEDALPGVFNQSDLDVFSQVMYKIYDDSSIALKAYDSVYDGKTFKNYQEKLLSLVSKQPLEKWDSEIDFLFINDAKDSGLFYNAFTLGIIDSNDGVSFTGDTLNFDNISPAKFKVLAESLNNSLLGHQAMRYLTMEFLDNTLGLKRFTSLSTTFDTSDSTFFATLSMPVETISFESNGEVKVTYFKDGTAIDGQKVATNSYIFFDPTDAKNFDDRPLAKDLQIEGTFNKVTISWNVSDYFLNLEDYRDYAIPSLSSFLEGIYDEETNKYINLSNNDSFVSFLKSNESESFTSLVRFLKEERSFFSTPYGDDLLPSKEGAFDASDVTISSLLKLDVSYSFHGVTTKVGIDLNKYMPHFESMKPSDVYKDIHNLIQKGDDNYQSSLHWIDKNIPSIFYFDAVYSGAAPMSYGGFSIPRIHVLNLLFSETAEAGALPLDEYLSTFESTSFDTLEGTFKGKLSSLLYKEVREYAKTENYFYSFATNPPTSVSDPSLRGSCNFASTMATVDASNYIDFVEASANLWKASTLLALNDEDMVGASWKMSASEKAIVKESLTGFVSFDNSSLKDVAVTYYQGLIYELFVNRSYFHSAVLTLPETDYIQTPFGDDGYFQNAGSTILVTA